MNYLVDCYIFGQCKLARTSVDSLPSYPLELTFGSVPSHWRYLLHGTKLEAWIADQVNESAEKVDCVFVSDFVVIQRKFSVLVAQFISFCDAAHRIIKEQLFKSQDHLHSIIEAKSIMSEASPQDLLNKGT